MEISQPQAYGEQNFVSTTEIICCLSVVPPEVKQSFNSFNVPVPKPYT